ncbi:MAG: alkaline phosphatase family protein [Planctomycetota bacterium]
MIRRIALLLAITGLLAGPHAVAGDSPACDLVIIISVDGLRSDALLVEPSTLPSLSRLRRGASTLNARTDPDFTVTLPNHVSMVTARPVLGPDGHQWSVNDIIKERDVLPDQAGDYVASIFDVAHDHGARTGVFVSKSKLRVLHKSWDEKRGRADRTGPDDGRNKIDVYAQASIETTAGNDSCSGPITDAVLDELRRPHRRRLLFVHYRHPDDVGHEKGWNLTPGSPYLRSIARVDFEIGRLLAQIDGDPALRGRAAVILTSDHGGGSPHLNHKRADLWINYVIPFMVWAGDESEPRDLYALNPASRADPGLDRTAGAGTAPPVYNSDSANLALSLLGLPPVPGSTINAGQDLDVGIIDRARPPSPSGSTTR